MTKKRPKKKGARTKRSQRKKSGGEGQGDTLVALASSIVEPYLDVCRFFLMEGALWYGPVPHQTGPGGSSVKMPTAAEEIGGMPIWIKYRVRKSPSDSPSEIRKVDARIKTLKPPAEIEEYARRLLIEPRALVDQLVDTCARVFPIFRRKEEEGVSKVCLAAIEPLLRLIRDNLDVEAKHQTDKRMEKLSGAASAALARALRRETLRRAAIDQLSGKPLTDAIDAKPPLTETQAIVFDQLNGAAYQQKALCAALPHIPWPTMRDALKVLEKRGLVSNLRGLGYYRPHAPPPLGSDLQRP